VVNEAWVSIGTLRRPIDSRYAVVSLPNLAIEATLRILDRLFPASLSARRAALTPQQRFDWDANGFLCLPGFMPRDEIGAVKAAVDREWANAAGNDHEIDILSGPQAFRTFRMAEVPEGSRREAYKLNNLFARRVDVRKVALSPRLRMVLSELLEGEPLICGRSSITRGATGFPRIASRTGA
jgi:hypothetical protein